MDDVWVGDCRILALWTLSSLFNSFLVRRSKRDALQSLSLCQCQCTDQQVPPHLIGANKGGALFAYQRRCSLESACPRPGLKCPKSNPTNPSTIQI